MNINESTQALADTYHEAEAAVESGKYARMENFYVSELEYSYVDAIHAILRGGLAVAYIMQEMEKAEL